MELPHMKPYQREDACSYALGPFVSFEFLTHRPELVKAIYLHSKAEESGCALDLIKRAAQLGIPCGVSDRTIAKLSPKENCWALTSYVKWQDDLSKDASHVVLVSPSDSGNVGTILRTALGFGVRDVAVISPAVDIHHPKTVRASMGAISAARTRVFACYDDWREAFPNHEVYPFMLTGSTALQSVSAPKQFALIFGNEASGLPDEFAALGTPVRIDHSRDIDSLNLSVAAAIGLWHFTKASS